MKRANGSKRKEAKNTANMQQEKQLYGGFSVGLILRKEQLSLYQLMLLTSRNRWIPSSLQIFFSRNKLKAPKAAQSTWKHHLCGIVWFGYQALLNQNILAIKICEHRGVQPIFMLYKSVGVMQTGESLKMTQFVFYHVLIDTISQ